MAEGGSAGNRRRGRSWTAFLDDVALGIAGAILAQPAFAAVVLLGANLALGSVLVSLGLAFLGGLALSRTDRNRSVLIFAGWVVLVCATRVFRSDITGSADAAPLRITISIAATVLAAAWASGGRRIWGVALLAVAGASVWTGLRAFPSPVALDLWSAEPVAISLLFVWLGSRGWTIAATVLAALAACAGAIFHAGSVPGLLWAAATAASAALSAASAVGLTVCGMAARVARRSAPRVHGDSALTAFARRPWVTALFLGAILRDASSWGLAWTLGFGAESSGFVVLAWVLATSAFLALLVSVSSDAFALLAPVTVLCAFASLDWVISKAFTDVVSGGSDAGAEFRALSLVLAMLAPQAVARVAMRHAPAIRRVRGVLVVGAVLAPCIARSAGLEDSLWALAAWAVLVPVVCVAGVAEERSSRDVIAFATLAGLVSGIALELTPGPPLDEESRVVVDFGDRPPVWFSLAAAWFLAAVLVVIARRARSFTPIPADHPVLADFPRAS